MVKQMLGGMQIRCPAAKDILFSFEAQSTDIRDKLLSRRSRMDQTDSTWRSLGAMNTGNAIAVDSLEVHDIGFLDSVNLVGANALWHDFFATDFTFN